MPALKKILESKMKIRFHDCDPFNHLNNAKYIDYIMSARGDQLLQDYDFDVDALARKKGIGWVAAQTQISYFSPAFPAEEVLVQTQLIGLSPKSLLLEGFMWDGQQSKLKALMWTKLVHFDLLAQRSTEHSPELMAFFKQVVNPLAGETRFETRVNDLKQHS